MDRLPEVVVSAQEDTIRALALPEEAETSQVKKQQTLRAMTSQVKIPL